MKPDEKKPEDLGLFLRNPNAWFDQQEAERQKRQQQEDADFEVVSERIEWLAERSYPISDEILCRDTGVTKERLEAISDRLRRFSRTVVDEYYFC